MIAPCLHRDLVPDPFNDDHILHCRTALKRLIHRAGRKGALVFYLHPYELDPTDAHAPTKLNSLKSRLYYWQQMAGRRGNPAKIEKLLQLAKFQ